MTAKCFRIAPGSPFTSSWAQRRSARLNCQVCETKCHVFACLHVSRRVWMCFYVMCPLLASDDVSQNRIQVNCGAPSSSVTFLWKQVSSCLARSLGYLQPEVPEVSRQIYSYIHMLSFHRWCHIWCEPRFPCKVLKEILDQCQKKVQEDMAVPV